MKPSSNIEKFNKYAALILAALYESFPVPREIACSLAGIDEEFGPEGQAGPETAFFMATLRWLADSGYLRHGQKNCVVFWDVVLTPKGLEALCAMPESLSGRAPLGERLKVAVSAGSKTAMAEAIKAVLAAGASRLFTL